MVTAHDGQASRDRGGNGTASEPDRVSIAQSDGIAVDATFRAPRITLGLKGEFDLAGASSLEREIETVPSPQPDRVRSDVEVRDLPARTSVGVAAFTARVRAVRAELQRYARPPGVGGRGRDQQFNRTRTS